MVEKYLPFNFFEDQTSVKLFSKLNQNFKLPFRNELRNSVINKFDFLQTKVKSLLANNDSKISLTIDSWTSIANRSYCGITCHFIDTNWNLTSFVLDFKAMSGQHSGQDIAQMVYDTLKDYRVENRIQGITTDNASANFKFVEHLEVLIGIDNFNSKDCHFVCFAHVINLAAQEFMNIIKVSAEDNAIVDVDSESEDSDEDVNNSENMLESPVNKIRCLLKKIKYSEQLQIKFSNCCNTASLIPTRPIIDIRTRWNSTFDMLNWAMKYKIPLNILCDTNKDFINLKVEEPNWVLIGNIVKFLKPLKTLSSLLGGEKYCTLSMVVLGINLLIDKYEKWAFELDRAHRTQVDEQLIFAINAARDKILKHYNKTNWMYCVALILDPRHKIAGFNLTPWGKTLKENSLKKFYDVFKQNYFEEIINEDATGNGHQENEVDNRNIDEDDLDFSAIFLSKPKLNLAETPETDYGEEKWKLEINAFFAEERAQKDTDILFWWKNHYTKYPNLGKMARAFFSTPATSVPSERLFSKASLVARKHRNRLNDDSLRSILCLNSWFKMLD